MTALATPPRQPAPRPRPPGSVLPAPRPPAPPASLFPWAEVALASVTLVTIAGLWRLFVNGSYFLPLAAHAIAAHVVVTVLRRLGVSLAVSGVVVAVAAAAILSWGHFWDTTTFGLPSWHTLDQVGEQLDEARRAFGDVGAPAPVLPGFVLALAVAVWAIAWLADVAAFRLWAPFEALIPSGTLFVFASIFAADYGRLLAAILWLTAALGFVLVHRTVRQESSPSWLGSDPRQGSLALLRAGTTLALAAIVIAAVAGPRLPGHGAVAVIGPDAFDDDSSSRQTVSPLVQIRGQLVEHSQDELFSVVASAPGYWRLTGLDQFDGEAWSSRWSVERVTEELPGLAERDDAAVNTQRFTITGLSSIWLPAQFEPRQILDDDDTEIRWEPESATLIVANDVPTSDGMEYEIVSAWPAYDPEVLRAATGEIPDEVRARGLGLPADFPPRVTDEALRVAAGAATPYDQARALQDYFRGGQFQYTLDAPAGHSDTAIESFLFDTRAGYCEQFAATYAAMARAVGLPARVAVGFTQGERDPAEPGRYIVRGRYAHAWPEVYLAGVGWVAFEPTPSRGNPTATTYTGVGPQQDGEAAPAPADGPAASTPEGTTPSSVGDPVVDGPLPDGGLSEEGLDFPATDGADAPGSGIDGRDVLRYLGWALVGVAAAAVLVVLVGAWVATWRAVRRLRRRLRVATPEDRVRVAWVETIESVGVLGVTPRPHETPVEFAERAATALYGDPRPGPLAETVEQADFAPDGVSAEEAAEAASLARGIRTEVHHQTTMRQRVLAAADPRPPSRRGRTRSSYPTGPRIEIRARAT